MPPPAWTRPGPRRDHTSRHRCRRTAPVSRRMLSKSSPRITLADHSLDTVMDKVAALTKRTIPGAAEVCVTFIQGGKATTAAYTGALALHLDERQYDTGYGPSLDSIVGGQPIHIDDMATETRWPDFAAEANKHGARSSLSIPVPVQREVNAALNIYGTEVGAFDEAALELAQTFAAYAGVALANMHLYEAQGKVAEQLQTAMASRAVIEQAKGILIGAPSCSPEDAFDLLVQLSQESNRKLRDVAQALVDDARTGSQR
jgi:GAF domain-containing protein